MKDGRLLFMFPAITALFLVSACATTAKMNVWKDQTCDGHVRKVLVMGLSQKKDTFDATLSFLRKGGF